VKHNGHRVGCNCDMGAPSPIPLLMELADSVCSDARPANGIYATMRGLGRFYAEIGRVLAGRSDYTMIKRDVMSRFVTPAAPSAYDRVLGRTCSYGLGFMVNLSEHQFGGH